MKNKSRAGIMAFLTVLVFAAVLFSDILKVRMDERKYKQIPLSCMSSFEEDRKDHSDPEKNKTGKETYADSSLYNGAVSSEVPVTASVTAAGSSAASVTSSLTSAVTTTVLSTVSSVTSSAVTTVPVTSVTEPETTAEPQTAPSEEYREPETQPPPEPEPEPQPDPEPEPEPEQPPAPPENNYPSASEYQSEVLRLVNIKRSEAGAGPLSASDALNYCAQIRADETVNVFSHQRPDGSECFSVLSQNGISALSAAENIAAGSPDPASVVEQWMNSESHRKNMLNPAYKSMGVGYSRYDGDDFVHYWVQLFTG